MSSIVRIQITLNVSGGKKQKEIYLTNFSFDPVVVAEWAKALPQIQVKAGKSLVLIPLGIKKESIDYFLDPLRYLFK